MRNLPWTCGRTPEKARGDEVRPPIRARGRNAWTALAEQNAVCLRCHDDTPRINWHGGVHESESVGCADCHQAHSRHPVRFEKMRCRDCHNAHGTFKDRLIRTAARVDLCLRCHAEKRGPVLWPHAPVVEDCTLCHYPHGSIQAALLKKRPPLLCHQCHNNVGHPSRNYTGEIDFSDASLTPLPNLESDLDNIEIYAEYDYSENLSYRAGYAYEVYAEKNWNLDEVIPGTIDNVLNLGETSPDYRIGVIWLSLKYRL